jgi:D-xylonolactonase
MTNFRIVPRDRVDRLGEGPLWSPSQNALFWVDITGQRLNRLALSDDAVTSWEIPETIGWVIERRVRPGFIAGLKSGFAELRLDPLKIVPLAAPEPKLPLNRLNDAKADARGRIFAGTMPMACDTPTGSLYRFDQDGSVTMLDTDYTVTNGPAISPDGAHLFHTDSVARCIYRFDMLPDGSLGPRSLFRHFDRGEGHPDGMTFDSDGGLWVACWGAGRIVRQLQLCRRKPRPDVRHLVGPWCR